MSWRQYKQKLEEDEDYEQYINQPSQQEGQQEGVQEQHHNDNNNDDDNEDDPLQAYMKELQQPQPSHKQQQQNKCNNEDDNQINLYHQQHIQYKEEEQFMEEESEQQIVREKKNSKIIQPLKAFDFSTVVLQPITKNFYQQHQEISSMDPQTHKKIMKQFEIQIKSDINLKPIVSFAHLPFPQKLISLIVDQGYQKPTPIQAQALPCVLSGRDVVGIAKTGSGKTLAFVWPMIIHVRDKRRSDKGQGPSALILAPTRQLCQQIYIETRKFTKKQNMRVECILGGENKHEQWKNLKAGVDILIASPGRLIQFIKKKATNLLRVSYFVLDEADRMLSLGFEQQIRSISSQIRQDRQTLLFTATMKKSMQMLVGDIVDQPIRIMVGDQGAANEDVKQQVIVIQEQEKKIEWIAQNIYNIVRQGKLLIFVNNKNESQKLGNYLSQQLHIENVVLHGDKNQYQRTTIMNSFKNQQSVLIATDIASRGIDVKNIKTVINYQCPKNIQVYIHRIGRAGRAGQTGTAFSFLLPSDVLFAISLVNVFQNSGYPVSQQLQELAMLDDKFRRKRISSKMGVTFAKGKDASKFLNHALKKQRKGFSRAGLGLQEQKDRNKKTNSGILNVSQQIDKHQDMSIGDISKLIKQKMQEKKNNEKFDGRFVLSTQQLGSEIKESTITFKEKKK